MTPPVMALLFNNACMCIASEMLFSVQVSHATYPSDTSDALCMTGIRSLRLRRSSRVSSAEEDRGTVLTFTGGLGMTEAQIGTQMSIRAVVHVGMMLVYAPVSRKLGTVRLYQVRLVACMRVGPR
jgi:hypothetical protein